MSKPQIDPKSKVNPKWKVGVVTSRFNEKVTARLHSGALAALKTSGFKGSQVFDFWVPGAYEIPLAAQWLLKYKKCDGVIALGAVIRGETTHYDYVCSAVERGCTQVQLNHNSPVVFAVLTTENEEQAIDRAGGAHGHKGVEAVQVLIEMLTMKRNLKTSKKEKTHG